MRRGIRNNVGLPFYRRGDIDFRGEDIIRSYREKTGSNMITYLIEPLLVETSRFAVRIEDSKRRRLEEFVLKGRYPDLALMAKRLLDIVKRLDQKSIEAAAPNPDRLLLGL